jgi:hypothetical protein
MNAYAILLMNGDGYLPGALVTVFSLKETKTTADIVVMCTADVSEVARDQLAAQGARIYPADHLRYKSKPLKTARIRELYPWIETSYSKWNVLNLPYDKVVLLDADILVIKNIDHLFEMQTPAAMFNNAFAAPSGKLPARFTAAGIDAHGWIPHGARIPHQLISRELKTGPLVGTSSVMVIKPNRDEYRQFCETMELSQPFGFPAVLNGHDEQSIMWFYATVHRRDFYNIHQQYGAIQFKPAYQQGEIYALHYFSDQKPWHTGQVWPDFQIWLDTQARAAKARIEQVPAKN